MFCPDCQANLDYVPSIDPCPGCGGASRGHRATNIIDHPLRTIGDRTYTIDRPAPRPWWEHWKMVKIALASLGECYQPGVQQIGLDGVNRRTCHFFVECDHLRDWVGSDDVNLPKMTTKVVDDFAFGNEFLSLCNAMANTHKARYYMLFALNGNVPSVARVIQIR